MEQKSGRITTCNAAVVEAELSAGFALCLSDWITTWTSFLGSLLGKSGVGQLSHLIVSLLSGQHDLESLEVGGLSSKCESVHFLEGWGGSPLVLQVVSLGGLLDSSGSGSSEQVESEPGQSESLKGQQHSWIISDSINENSVIFGHINNDDQLSVILSEIDETNSTWFNDVSNSLYTYESMSCAQNLPFQNETLY